MQLGWAVPGRAGEGVKLWELGAGQRGQGCSGSLQGQSALMGVVVEPLLGVPPPISKEKRPIPVPAGEAQLCLGHSTPGWGSPGWMGSLGWMQSWPSFGGCSPQSRSEMEQGAGTGQKGDREVTRCPCLQCRVQGWAVHGGGGGAGHTQCWGGRGCVQGWLGSVVELFSACVQHRESMCAHTRVHWSKAMQGVWESTCGSVWRDTGVCPRRSCVCARRVCGLAVQ